MLINTLLNWICWSYWACLADIAAVIGIPIAVMTLFFTANQIHQKTKSSRGQFELELEKMFYQHDEVHRKLRPGGDWTKDNAGPEDNVDWAKVEDYMGLFEHCELMLRNKIIDWETFDHIFSYRLWNIYANEIIKVGKLENERDSWLLFIALLNRIGIIVHKPKP
ncbi:hypothetical protein KKB18_10900 [bacterium]|nr:hypothetical protein [bacterium]